MDIGKALKWRQTSVCLSFPVFFFILALFHFQCDAVVHHQLRSLRIQRFQLLYKHRKIPVTSLKLNTPKASEIASTPTHTTDTHTHTAQSGKPITQNILHENQNQWQNYWTQTWRITNGSKSRWEFNIFNSELILSKFWIWNVFYQLQSRNGRYKWDIVCDECIKAAQNN